MRAALLALALAACSPVNAAFTCFSSTECGAGGTCEANGFCSFFDSECPSGKRYGSAADPAHKDACVGGDESDAGVDGGLQYEITVMVSGDGTIASNPTGIDCGATCGAKFDIGTLLTLTPTPKPGEEFLGWGGVACTGAGVGACQFTVVGQRTVTAAFTTSNTATPSLIMSIQGNGAGAVTSTPAGIQCGTSPADTQCLAQYTSGQTVMLHAQPAAGSTFGGWSGDSCTGTADCAFTITGTTHVFAMFTQSTATLTVSKVGAGTGTVTSTPAGIACGATCMASFPINATVALAAVADAGSVFSGWTGGGCSGTGACSVPLTSAMAVSATFDATALTSLTVTKSGTGIGSVTSASGIDCGPTCSKLFGAGAMVTLTATAMPGSSFTGWTGACTGTAACTITISQAQSTNAAFTATNPNANYAFVTSTQQTAALGGLAGADALCQARAAAGFVPGTFRALLSTSTVNAIDRLGAARGWIRVDGRPVADTQADLTSSRLLYPIALDEFGHQELATGYAFTGSDANGHADIQGILTSCMDFTSASTTDRAAAGSPYATDSCALSCSNPVCGTAEPLLCFGIDRSSAVTLPVADARRAFMSAGAFTPGGGITAADSLCQSEAMTGGLTGTYKALLATTTAAAISRFDTSALAKPWARADNAVIAPTAAALGTPGLARLDASPMRLDHSGASFWSGAALPTALGTATSTCDNWTSTASAAGARGGSWDTDVAQWFGIGDTNQVACTTAFPVVCFQQ